MMQRFCFVDVRLWLLTFFLLCMVGTPLRPCCIPKKKEHSAIHCRLVTQCSVSARPEMEVVAIAPSTLSQFYPVAARSPWVSRKVAIHEIDSFRDYSVQKLLGVCDTGAVVFFDIDNTLTYCESEQLIEPYVLDLIKQMKGNGARVVGLTARSSSDYAVQITCNVLDALGVKFTKGNAEELQDRDVRLYCGCVFANGENKGGAIQAYLNHLRIVPRHVVSFDDFWFNIADEAYHWHEHGWSPQLTLFCYTRAGGYGYMNNSHEAVRYRVEEAKDKDKILALLSELSPQQYCVEIGGNIKR